MEYSITLKNYTSIRPHELYNHETAARLADVSVRYLLRCWNHGIVAPVSNTGRYGIYFDDEAIYRLRQADYLRRERGINISGIALILSLGNRIEELEAEIKFLKKRF